jgi:hypothetical protein
MSSLIFKKMSLVMADIGSIGKDQKNLAQGFKFRGIDQFVNGLYPALVKHGVFIAPRCVSERSEVKEVTRSSGKVAVDKYVTILMEYDFFAEDGSKVTIGPIPAEGLDSGDKATNKALSAALKYALIQTFSVPTEDMAEADLDSPSLGSAIPVKAAKAEAGDAASSTAQAASAAQATTVAQAATVSKPSPFRGKPATTVKQQTSSPSDAF